MDFVEKDDCKCNRLFLAGAEGLEPSARGFGGEKLRGEKSFFYWVSWAFGGSRHKLCHNTVDEIGTNRKGKKQFCSHKKSFVCIT